VTDNLDGQLALILQDYEGGSGEVVQTWPRPESTHGPVRVVKFSVPIRGWGYDVWVGEECIYLGINTEDGAQWLAANFAPEAKPTY
jgi:hypothetical protein